MKKNADRAAGGCGFAGEVAEDALTILGATEERSEETDAFSDRH